MRNNRDKYTPYQNKNSVNNGILSGNTYLANCEQDEFQQYQQTKAPKKEKRIMKASRRFKIFGPTKKSSDNKGTDEKVPHSLETTKHIIKDSDLDQKRNLKDFIESIEYESDYHLSSLHNKQHDRDEVNLMQLKSNDIDKYYTDCYERLQSIDMDIGLNYSLSSLTKTVESDLSKNIDKIQLHNRTRSHSTIRSNKYSDLELSSRHYLRKISSKENDRSRSIDKDEHCKLFHGKEEKVQKSNSHENNIPSMKPPSQRNALRYYKQRSLSGKFENDFYTKSYEYNESFQQKLKALETYRGNDKDDFDTKTQISELSMFSPTTAKNNQWCVFEEMLDIENFKCSALLRRIREPLELDSSVDEEEEDEDINSDGSNHVLPQGLVEIPVDPFRILPSTSSLSSNTATEILSKDNDNKAELKQEIYQLNDAAKITSEAAPTQPNNYKSLLKKWISSIKYNFVGCFNPVNQSPPSQRPSSAITI